MWILWPFASILKIRSDSVKVVNMERPCFLNLTSKKRNRMTCALGFSLTFKCVSKPTMLNSWQWYSISEEISLWIFINLYDLYAARPEYICAKKPWYTLCHKSVKYILYSLNSSNVIYIYYLYQVFNVKKKNTLRPSWHPCFVRTARTTI